MKTPLYAKHDCGCGYSAGSGTFFMCPMHEAAAELLAALEAIEDILGFHEGSETTHKGDFRENVVWINAQSDEGDFQQMLSKARAAIAKAKARKE